MLNVIGIILGILIPSLWIFLPLKRVPEEIRTEKSKYIKSIIMGATLCTVLIIILESVWDKVTGIAEGNPATVAEAALASFTRAALLEEAAKYIFVKHVFKKYRPVGKMQYILLAGTIGMGYGIVEKLVNGSAVSMLVNAVFALHIMYQFIMGMYLYKADETDDRSKKRLFGVCAFAVPFIIHGLWDFMLFGGVLCLDPDRIDALSITVIIVMAGSVIGAVAGEIKMALYLKRIKVIDEVPEAVTDSGEEPENTEK